MFLCLSKILPPPFFIYTYLVLHHTDNGKERNRRWDFRADQIRKIICVLLSNICKNIFEEKKMPCITYIKFKMLQHVFCIQHGHKFSIFKSCSVDILWPHIYILSSHTKKRVKPSKWLKALATICYSVKNVAQKTTFSSWIVFSSYWQKVYSSLN